MTKIDTQKIIDRLADVQSKTIVVLGDFCLDKYIYSDPEQDDVSVETSKEAWQIYKKKMSAGAAGTITNNLRALGAKVICVGFAGNDGEGFEMIKALQSVGADTSYMIATDEFVTPTYLKTMRKIDGVYREDIRFDFRNSHAPSKDLALRLLENFSLALQNADGAVISDQFYESDSGAISDEVREGISEAAKKHDVPILVDSRAFATRFKNTFVKCNNFELMKYCNAEGDPENRDDVINGCKKLSGVTGGTVFITRNRDGVIIYNGEISEIPAYPVHGEIDVTGAGDASNAGIILGLALGLTPSEAAKIACAVSFITIHILGETGTASILQVVKKLNENI